MQLRVEATNLPGLAGVTVGVQRRGRPAEVLDLVPTARRKAAWTVECTVRERPEGLDVTGPYVDGRPGARYVYLSWWRDGEMFRRAKLMLDAVPPEVLEDAADIGVLTARLGLTDGRGGPLCAAVRPPAVRWSVR